MLGVWNISSYINGLEHQGGYIVSYKRIGTCNNEETGHIEDIYNIRVLTIKGEILSYKVYFDIYNFITDETIIEDFKKRG